MTPTGKLRMYHFQGESLPDRFEFSSIKDRTSGSDGSIYDGSEGEAERDTRSVQRLASEAVAVDTPTRFVAIGPGGLPGPRRYLGVMKPVVLYKMLRAWVCQHGLGTRRHGRRFGLL